VELLLLSIAHGLYLPVSEIGKKRFLNASLDSKSCPILKPRIPLCSKRHVELQITCFHVLFGSRFWSGGHWGFLRDFNLIWGCVVRKNDSHPNSPDSGGEIGTLTFCWKCGLLFLLFIDSHFSGKGSKKRNSRIAPYQRKTYKYFRHTFSSFFYCESRGAFKYFLFLSVRSC
jgi:hypothetical protein